MHLARFPRARFAHLPTPLEPMSGLSAALGGPELWVKRDDCTGLAGGGNKTRKLEFLLGDALDHATVEVHLSNLRRKIGPEHIHTVRGVGYRWVA